MKDEDYLSFENEFDQFVNKKQVLSLNAFNLNILPFTASINAMYERLKNETGGLKNVGLVHGKLAAYLVNLLERENPDITKTQRIFHF